MISLIARYLPFSALLALFVYPPAIGASPGKSAISRVVVQATTDWTYHGISENRSEPSLGVYIDRAWPNGISAGVESHIALISSPGERQRGSAYFAAYDRKLSDDQAISVNLRYRHFPGDRGNWQYWETGIAWRNANGVEASYEYSPDYYGRYGRSHALEVSYGNNLSNSIYYKTGIGAVARENWPNHRYASAAIGYMLASGSAELSYEKSWPGTDGQFRDFLSSPGFVFRLTYQIY